MSAQAAAIEAPARPAGSLFWKLAGTFLVLLAGVGVVHGLTVGRVIRDVIDDYQVQVFQREVELGGRFLPEASLHPPDRDALGSWIERTYASSPGLSALLFDAQGQRLASLRPPTWIPAELDALRAAAARPRARLRSMRRNPPVVCQRLESQGQVYYLAATNQHRGGRILRRRAPWLPLTPLLFTLVAAALAGLLGLRLLTRRLGALREGVRAIAAGDLSTRLDPGSPDEVGAVLRDVNAMAAQLEANQRELRDAQRRRSDLIADVSHELRTPLTTLTGHLELLRDGDGGTRSAAIALDEARALAARIDELLTLARGDAEGLTLRTEAVNLQRLLAEVADAAQPLFDERDLALERAFTGQRVEVEADPQRLAQVFRNLLENARAATPGGGRVALRVRPSEGEVRVEVEDDGQGIPADDLPHVFERFFRGEGRRGGGTGLGLAICQRLVQLHGGRCEATSEVGVGSTFAVVLPTAAEVEPEDADGPHDEDDA